MFESMVLEKVWFKAITVTRLKNLHLSHFLNCPNWGFEGVLYFYWMKMPFDISKYYHCFVSFYEWKSNHWSERSSRFSPSILHRLESLLELHQIRRTPPSTPYIKFLSPSWLLIFLFSNGGELLSCFSFFVIVKQVVNGFRTWWVSLFIFYSFLLFCNKYFLIA